MIYDHFLTLLDREIDGVRHNLIHGSCPDYATYRQLVGELQAFEAVRELAKKAFDEDEDDEAAPK